MTGRLSAGAAFGLGVVAGVFLKEGMQRMQDVARRKLAHHEYQHTLAFDDNLPDALERREPEPQPGQPRFGGTGAIGISPAAVKTSPR